LTDNKQQLKPIKVRAGYQVSSAQLNDFFDAAIFDLITILQQAPLAFDDDTKEIMDAFALLEGLQSQQADVTEERVIRDHTENWRKI
jgi:hypothetical protein